MNGPIFRRYDPALLQAWREGVDEFNAGRFWDAHERWERGWKALPEPERSWVQGWIQLAGVMCLIGKGRAEAAGRLARRALVKLESAREMRAVLPRIEIEGGLAALEGFFGATAVEVPASTLKARLLTGPRM